MSFFFDPVKFWMIAARLSGFIIASPGFGEVPIPAMTKGALIMWLTILTLPLVPTAHFAMNTPWDALYVNASEFLLGTGFGLVVRFVFGALQLGGFFIDSELGLLMAQQMNPMVPFSGGVFGQIFLTIGLFYFFALDYFSVLIVALQQSFKIVPLASMVSGVERIDVLVRLGAGIFTGGLMIAAPIIALMFFVTVSVGFLARAVQGIQIFYEIFTLKILLGFGAVTVLLPLLLMLLREQMQQMIPAASEYFRTVMPAP